MLSYRPEFLKRTAFAFGAQIRSRAKAPAPHTAPVPLYAGEPARGCYTPGPVLAHSERHGVILFRDAPEAAWRDHGRPAIRRRRDLSLRMLLLQGALLAAALLWGAMITPGAGQ